MKIAIMQPYFMPYIGYFQLISSVNKFVLYDNIQYTKKGWINRNRFLLNGKDKYMSLPLKKDSDFLDVNQRNIHDDFDKDKLINQLENAYRKAPLFNDGISLVYKIINYNKNNLFLYLKHSIDRICTYLEIETPIIISSSIDINHSLRAQEKVIAICQKLQANTYINPIGGKELYSKTNFMEYDIDLQFIQSSDIYYKQFNNQFVPWLSIIDLIMFNDKNKLRNFLSLATFV